MTTQKQDMKKKRRSFYEPDSEAIRQWLDNQKDFGRTLQLLAVDAMAKYGTGDAIEGMLHLRTQEPQATQVPVVEQAVHTPPVVTPAPVQPTPQPVPQPTVAPQVQVAPTPAPVTQAQAVPVTPVPANTNEQAPQAGLDAIDALFK